MMENLRLSLTDLLGADYTRAVCEARALLTGESPEALRALADERIDWYPEAFARRQEALMEKVGCRVTDGFANSEAGAPTDSYRAAQHGGAAPLSAFGAFRVGEDGRLYFTGKSEHYQIPLGHDFPGYALIDRARALGVPNATHNNTRGFITRTLERRLIAAANGLRPDDPALEGVIASREPGVLSRVINLETGSLAVEAALKMMLTRFYSLDGAPAPYAGRIPVFLVMADQAGGLAGNYHGTTVVAQTLRGLWPELTRKIEDAGIYRVVSVPINDAEGFRQAVEAWNTPPYKTAGFCHEIIMMNYGAIRLEEAYLQAAYRLCRGSDTPVLCDEIQSCAWYEGLFLLRQYGLAPDFVSVGKGFPGGVYPASRLLLSGAFDSAEPVRRAGHQRPGGAGQPGLPDYDDLHRGQRAAHPRYGPPVPRGDARARRAAPGPVRGHSGRRAHDGAALPPRPGRHGVLPPHGAGALRGHQRPDLQAQLPARYADQAAADYHTRHGAAGW